jgi:hypothetical protein
MKVITEKALQAQVDRLNKITNSPLKPYELKDGKYIAQVGNYYLDGAYGGWQLARMMSEGGSITDVLRTGHISKRDLYNRLAAFISGIEFKS